MAKSIDVAVLGTGFRGIWLATELAKLGWSVSWIQLQKPHSNVLKGGFEFDDTPWQLGSPQSHSKLLGLSGKFISQVICPEPQEVAIQILTPKGPLELSGGLEAHGLSAFFKDTYPELHGFLEGVKQAAQLEKKRADQLISAHARKVFERPMSKRWVLEWLGALRVTRALSTEEWILKHQGEVLDATAPYLNIKDGKALIVQRALEWAAKQGVVIHREAKIVGIDVDGRKASGIVFDRAEGYLQCGRLVFSCSSQTIESKFPKFAKHIKMTTKAGDEKWVWARCGFMLAPNSKPAGMQRFSSFVIDPLMPLVEAGFGLMRWKPSDKGESLTVWARVPTHELTRKSFLIHLRDLIQKNLEILLPRFKSQLVATYPFEDNLSMGHLSHDDLSIIFNEKTPFQKLETRLSNVYLAGPESDHGFDVLSQLGTELKLVEKLAEIRMKELPRDRALHSPRDGQKLVHPQ